VVILPALTLCRPQLFVRPLLVEKRATYAWPAHSSSTSERVIACEDLNVCLYKAKTNARLARDVFSARFRVGKQDPLYSFAVCARSFD
jgi:hypothetical protein